MFETTVCIDGMMCGMCEAHIGDVIRQNFDVHRVSASHKKGRAVIVSAQPIDEAALRAAIEKTGYAVTAVSVRTLADAPKKGGLLGLFRR